MQNIVCHDDTANRSSLSSRAQELRVCFARLSYRFLRRHNVIIAWMGVTVPVLLKTVLYTIKIRSFVFFRFFIMFTNANKLVLIFLFRYKKNTNTAESVPISKRDVESCVTFQ